jgi:hypothetical protein
VQLDQQLQVGPSRGEERYQAVDDSGLGPLDVDLHEPHTRELLL